MYKTPPDKLQQGCLVEAVYFYAIGTERPAIALSPSCDFENDKADFATFLALFPYKDMLKRLLLTKDWRGIFANPDKPSKKDALNKITKLLSCQMDRYHWFDELPSGDQGPWIADFQITQVIPKDEFSRFRVFAALNSEYMENLPARWVSYAGRIGVPNRVEGQFEQLQEQIYNAILELGPQQ